MTDNELETFSFETLNKHSKHVIVTEIYLSFRCNIKLLQKRSIDYFFQKNVKFCLTARGKSKVISNSAHM